MSMSFLKSAFAAVIVSVVGLGAAHAQVLVMNEERILVESAAGRQIAEEISRIRTDGEARLTQESERLQAERDALSAETSALSQAAMDQRPDLVERFNALTTSGVELEVDRLVLQEELAGTYQQAMVPVLETLQVVLQQIVDETDARVLLDRSQVVFVDDAASVTELAIERMDSTLPSTQVDRIHLNDEQRGIIRQQVVNQFVQQQRMMAQAQAAAAQRP